MIRRGFVISVVVALAAAGCSVHPNDNVLPGQEATGSNGYQVVATFDSVENLVPNSAVQHDDVVIGTITKISVQNWKANVTLRLLKSVKLPANARFVIGQKTLLGAQFVDIVDPPAPTGRLAAGSRVSQASTGGYPETEQVLSAVSLLLNNGGLSQIETITSELNKTFKNRIPDTRAVIGRLNLLLGTLNGNKTKILSTLEQLNRLSGTIADDRKTVSNAVATIGPGLASLNAERDQLVDAIDSLGRFSTAANQLVNTSSKALLANLGAIRPVLAEIDKAGKDLPKSLDIILTTPFPVATARNAIKGDYANLFLTLDVSGTSLAESFLGLGKTAPVYSQAKDPIAAPLGLSGSPLSPGSSGGAATPGDPIPTPAQPSVTPDKPCGLLESLFGGCK